MSGFLNKAQLIGHLGKDPEIRHTQDGRPIANFSIATSESWRDKATGERKEQTEWHRVVIFNEALAKVAEQYLRKGSQVYIEGQIKTRKYTDQAGVEKYTTEIVLNYNCTLTMLGKRDGSPPPATGAEEYGTAKPPSGDKRPSAVRDLDDEVPF